jgi:hypothetical protein
MLFEKCLHFFVEIQPILRVFEAMAFVPWATKSGTSILSAAKSGARARSNFWSLRQEPPQISRFASAEESDEENKGCHKC